MSPIQAGVAGRIDGVVNELLTGAAGFVADAITLLVTFVVPLVAGPGRVVEATAED